MSVGGCDVEQGQGVSVTVWGQSQIEYDLPDIHPLRLKPAAGGSPRTCYPPRHSGTPTQLPPRNLPAPLVPGSFGGVGHSTWILARVSEAPEWPQHIHGSTGPVLAREHPHSRMTFIHLGAPHEKESPGHATPVPALGDHTPQWTPHPGHTLFPCSARTVPHCHPPPLPSPWGCRERPAPALPGWPSAHLGPAHTPGRGRDVETQSPRVSPNQLLVPRSALRPDQSLPFNPPIPPLYPQPFPALPIPSRRPPPLPCTPPPAPGPSSAGSPSGPGPGPGSGRRSLPLAASPTCPRSMPARSRRYRVRVPAAPQGGGCGGRGTARGLRPDTAPPAGRNPQRPGSATRHRAGPRPGSAVMRAGGGGTGRAELTGGAVIRPGAERGVRGTARSSGPRGGAVPAALPGREHVRHGTGRGSPLHVRGAGLERCGGAAAPRRPGGPGPAGKRVMRGQRAGPGPGARRSPAPLSTEPHGGKEAAARDRWGRRGGAEAAPEAEEGRRFAGQGGGAPGRSRRAPGGWAADGHRYRDGSGARRAGGSRLPALTPSRCPQTARLSRRRSAGSRRG